ncbi:MAG: long-chain fatty acid--CoA ligase [Thermoanaerobaculia bacterium]|nr:long-chain fatty acid--CoA ligase [Thermoanaerobaculia bacterium]
MAARVYSSVVDIFHHRVASTPDADAMYGRRNGQWYTLTWRETAARVRKIACGLLSLGQQRSGRVAILSGTRPEWVLADLGILAAAGATSTIYPSNTPEECAYILADSGAVFCFAENPVQLEKLLQIRAEVPALERVILLDGVAPAGQPWVITLAELESAGSAWDAAHPGEYEKVSGSVTREDLATLIYTSGTTGKPKGVMLAHDNWVFEAEAIAEMALLRDDDKQYLFLPLAHSFAKVLEVGFIITGAPTAIDGNIDDLVDNLGVVKPTVMGAVPRIFEKVYNKVVTGAREAGGLKYKIFTWAVAVGRQVSVLRQRGDEPGGLLKIKHRVADKLVFSKLKARFGGRIRYFVSGGAPLAREIAEFFHAADILVLEGYGLTESSAASFVNRYNRFKFGSVGPAVPGLKVKIAEDGEILLSGRGVMQGYYKLPEATAETLVDGWLHTGDIGVLDSDGFLTITDRKKDIIVTAGGKNVAPQNVENLLKASSAYISQIVMLGDKRPFCVALIAINEETVGKWAKEKGLTYGSYAELSALPAVKDLIWGVVKAGNERLAAYEQIKKIHLLDHELSQDSGELTPKMSIKRKVVEQNNREILEGLYGG